MKQAYRKDLLVILGLLVLSGILYLLFQTAAGKSSPAQYVVVWIDGKEAGRYSLKEDREIPFTTKLGRISDGKAFMTEADCPDGYCLEQHAISRTGDRIVCLPHRLIAEAVSAGPDVDETAASSGAKDDPGVDAVAG